MSIIRGSDGHGDAGPEAQGGYTENTRLEVRFSTSNRTMHKFFGLW